MDLKLPSPASVPTPIPRSTLPLHLDDVRRARMHSLLLTEPEARDPLDVATWFGAMQAQDAASGHWSLACAARG